MRHIRRGSKVYTDEHKPYQGLPYHQHEYTTHSQGQYVNVDCHTNTIDSFWAILKRAHKGVDHWWPCKHFSCYLAECELCWNTRGRSEGDEINAMLRSVNDNYMSYENLAK